MHTPTGTALDFTTIVDWLVVQETRLHRSLQRRALRRALRAAYARFAAHNRVLSESLFDAHFVETRVAPLLARALEADQALTAEQVAEAWFNGCKAPGADRASTDLGAIATAAAELLSYVEQALRPVAHEQPVPAATLSESDSVAAALFAEAVRANSNLELDWLWLYTRMTGSYERSYCLQKALQINPHSELARRELAALTSAAPVALLPAAERA